MMEKLQIVDILGEKALVLPALLQTSLVANERAKYLLSVLQMAVSHADHSDAPAVSLQFEREACGIADASLDRAAPYSRSDDAGYYIIPSVRNLIALLDEAMRAMLAPIEAAAVIYRDKGATFERFRDRLERLIRERPGLDRDAIAGDTIAVMTSGDPPGGDGFHILIMDLHKEIDRLLGAIATEEVSGAKAYGIVDADRKLITAFMVGLKRTAPLKFDHPGLETVVVRQDDTLLIQNDIGATEAHVLVIRVTGLNVKIIHTDIHAQRLQFFQRLFDGSGVNWEEWRAINTPRVAGIHFFYLARGSFEAQDASALSEFLERLGSRIVFLIDWNKARKRLGLMMPNADAVDILHWAAANNFGHRAFLQLGGERLIYSALEQVVKTPLRYGEPLHEIIGTEPAAEYLRFVLQMTATGLLQHRSEGLIRDEVRAELFSYFRSAESRLLDEAARHAKIIADIASSLRQGLRQWTDPKGELLIRDAADAKLAETQADEIVKAMRDTVRHMQNAGFFVQLLEVADDAADDLEEAAFFVGLLPGRVAPSELPPTLLTLADLLSGAGEAYRDAINVAQTIRIGGTRADRQHFLEAVDRLVAAEHQSDACERATTVALLDARLDARQISLLREVAGRFEWAADALLHASLILRDHILGGIMRL